MTWLCALSNVSRNGSDVHMESRKYPLYLQRLDDAVDDWGWKRYMGAPSMSKAIRIDRRAEFRYRGGSRSVYNDASVDIPIARMSWPTLPKYPIVALRSRSFRVSRYRPVKNPT